MGLQSLGSGYKHFVQPLLLWGEGEVLGERMGRGE